MQELTTNKIRTFKPCYDPTKYLAEDWKGSILDILEHNEIPDQDKIWVATRPRVLSDKTLRLFAAYCAREALKLNKNPDIRSLKAIEVAELHAHGRATNEELRDAAYTAYAAANATAADAAAAAAAARKQVRTKQVKQLIKLILEG